MSGALHVLGDALTPAVTRTPGNEYSLAILKQMPGTPAGLPAQSEDIAYAVGCPASR